MANFIALVYATLKNEGVDTSGMSTDEAVAKFNELQKKLGGESGEKSATPAEQRRLEQKGIVNNKNYKKLLDSFDCSELFGEAYKEFYKNITAEEYYSLKDYTRNIAYDINDCLAFPSLLDKWSPKWKNEFKEYVKNIDNALTKFETKENFITYRTTSLNRMLKDMGIKEIQNVKDLEGKIFNPKYYLSTSPIYGAVYGLNEEWGQDVILEISVDKGYNKGAYINDLSYSGKNKEFEYLLPRNKKYRIVSVSNLEGKNHIILKEL